MQENYSSYNKRISVRGGRTLLLSGPASIKLVDGQASIFASPLRKEHEIVIGEGRRVPIEATMDSILQCSISGSTQSLEITGSTIPESWTETAQTIVEYGRGRTTVVGDVDTGKTGFCTILTNTALNSGLSVGIIDADLGQSDIGPPGTIGFGRAASHIFGLSDVLPDRMYFVGYISPAPAIDKVLFGMRRLLKQTKNTDIIIVNTDGWVLGDKAVLYKKSLIDLVDPDFVVGIGDEGETNTILQLTKQTSFQIQSPRTVFRRTRDQRKQLRELRYRQYLNKSVMVKVDAQRFKLSHCSGQLLRPDNLDSSLIRSLLGMLDGGGWLRGIGVLSRINRQDKTLRILTPVCHFSAIEIGAVRLDEYGTELSYLE